MSVIMITEKRKMRLGNRKRKNENRTAGFYLQTVRQKAHHMAPGDDVLYLSLSVDKTT